MKVEIWSDVMCPFCYIGKRRFENALKQFSEKEKVQVEWKSYQLNPDLVTESNKNLNEYLSETKGWTIDYVRKLNERIIAMAQQEGLTYNFNHVIVANSFDAHRLSHLAKKYNLQNELEEKLFSAYFTEGKNTGDKETLAQLGVEVGLDADEAKEILNGKNFTDEVRQDIYEAQQLGISGVPFFLFNNKYAISGAQETKTFIQALDIIGKESNN